MLALVSSKTAAELDKEWQETPATSLSRWGRLKQEIREVMGLIMNRMLTFCANKLKIL